MKQALNTAIVGTTILSSLPMLAQAEFNPYLTITGGYATVGDQNFDTGTSGDGVGPVTTELDGGYALTAAAGNDWGFLRGEVELGTRSAEVNVHRASSGPLASSDGRATAWSLMFNGYFDLENPTNITPFAGAGIGLANVTLEEYETESDSVVDDSDTVPAVQLMLGADMALPNTWTAQVGYRVFRIGEVDIQTELGDNASAVEFISQEAFVGLGLKF